MAKNQVSGPILGHLVQIWANKFWSAIAMYNIKKKLMIQAWENLVTDERTNEQTDERTDEQTDESDLTGRCPTNVERPTKTNQKKETKNANINSAL